MNIKINSKKTVLILLMFATSLLLIHISGQYYVFANKTAVLFNETPLLFLAIDFFNVDHEYNVPIFFSVSILLISSSLLIIIALKQTSRGAFAQWLLLGILLFFLAFDEMSSLHELIGSVIKTAVEAKGYFGPAWVIPYLILAVAVFLLYFRFLLRLPKRTAILFVVSGAIYTAGAAGFEILAVQHGQIYGEAGRETMIYYFYKTSEEAFEMYGIILFIYSLLSYIATRYENLSLQFK